ncbi:MAG: 2-amino-4-hydroxy-6-hydroxymethyldihydropteridine diphosphokinase [Prolixibacteraceae bacterium]|nr:2-amino-4-hydroxy-6-hydroxymethyldihydropteridine diphosphokinase [Prolixibacteraceae bacterium]
MAIIKVKNLLLRTFIGFNPDELTSKQDVIINFEIETDVSREVLETDDPAGILNYKVVTKKVIELVQAGRFNLLEVLTNRILDLLLAEEKVKYARVEVDKPHALRFAESVSLVMERKKSGMPADNGNVLFADSRQTSIAIVGIGSNINAEENISKMLNLLGARVRILKVSSLVKTKPIGITHQSDFTNGAVKIETQMQQGDFKNLLKSIEDELGRDRNGPKFGPRTIDLDLIVWNGEVVDKEYFSRDFLKRSVEEVI